VLPKITYPEQVTLLAGLLEQIESSAGLTPGVLKIELMIETPQSIFNAYGRVAPPNLVAAGRGRVVGVHFGRYDYTALLNGHFCAPCSTRLTSITSPFRR